MSIWDWGALFQQCRNVYATRVWPRLIAQTALVAAAVLLLRLSGGFPPAAWVFLLHVLPDVPRLWLLRGPALLLSLGGLAALAGTQALAWAALLRMAWAVVRPCKRGQQEHVSLPAALKTQLCQGREGEACPSPSTGIEDELVRCARGDNDTSSSSEVSSAWAQEAGDSTVEQSVPAFQAHEEAGAQFAVGSCLHRAANLPWREDCLFVTQGSRVTRSRTIPYGLFIVADGVGGHRLSGHDACQLAIGVASSHILAALTGAGMSESAWDEQELMAVVAEGVQAANRALYRCNQEHGAYMEGSLAVCCVVDTTAYVASMGEALTFRYRASSGLLSMAGEPGCLGEQARVHVNTYVTPLLTGDRLLLCSDGLWKVVPDHCVGQVLSLSESGPLEMSSKLVQAALERGGEDHIAGVVVQC